MVKKFATTLFASTAPNPSVRIIISYYSTTRLEREQILGLFELCPNPPKKIPEKFVLNSIWLNYGSMVIRLQRLQTATCKNMLVSILHSILTSLECLTSFHKGLFTQSYLEVRTEMRLKNYLRLEISKHLLLIMLLTKKVSDVLFPCPMRITLNLPLDLRVLPALILSKLVPYFVRLFTLPADSLPLKAKSMMMDT